MIEKIQIILDVLGIVTCVVGAVCTGEMGYFIATMWAVTAFTTRHTLK